MLKGPAHYGTIEIMAFGLATLFVACVAFIY